MLYSALGGSMYAEATPCRPNKAAGNPTDIGSRYWTEYYKSEKTKSKQQRGRVGQSGTVNPMGQRTGSGGSKGIGRKKGKRVGRRGGANEY